MAESTEKPELAEGEWLCVFSWKHHGKTVTRSVRWEDVRDIEHIRQRLEVMVESFAQTVLYQYPPPAICRHGADHHEVAEHRCPMRDIEGPKLNAYGEPSMCQCCPSCLADCGEEAKIKHG